ncbi:hypothetical protein ACQY0O_006804 [Thecaphora frezii]
MTMSPQDGPSKSRAAAAAQRGRSLLQLLDPSDLMPGHTVADLYSLRHLSLQGGIPDSPSWLRAQAWKVLLGYLPPEKKEWPSVLHKRRQEYYRFVSDLSPQVSDSDDAPTAPLAHPTERDVLLDQIYKDLSRSKKNGFAFYQSEVRPSRSCPLAPEPPALTSAENASGSTHKRSVDRLAARHALLNRLAQVNADFAEQLGWSAVQQRGSKSKGREKIFAGQAVVSPSPSGLVSNGPIRSSNSPDGTVMSPPIYLSPPSPGGASSASSHTSFASAEESRANGSLDDASDAGAATDAQDDNRAPDATARPTIVDRNWHSLLRILYFFAILNPSIGYVQGMNEALFTLFYAFGTAGPLPQISASATSELPEASEAASVSGYALDNEDDGTSPHAEADAFWCFSMLIGEVKELYDFEGVDRAMSGGEMLVKQPSSAAAGNFLRIGMAGALKRFSLRLKWLESELWRNLRTCSLDPRMPFYSFRWLACLVSTELSLPSVLRVWDALLSEQETSLEGAFPAKIEFLIDICCALLIQIKPLLPAGDEPDSEDEDPFSKGMRVLQAYPDEDIGPVIETAVLYRQRRLAADLTGDGPPDTDSEDAEVGLASVRSRAAQTLQRWGRATGPQSPLTGERSVSASVGGNLTPVKSSGWFGSVGRSFSGGDAPRAADDSLDTSRGSSGWTSAMSTPSRSAVGGVFQRYAEAIQSSDAAANLSKASTNLTAKALVSFGGSGNRESSPDDDRAQGMLMHAKMPSLGTMGASFFRKGRSGSDATGTAMGRGSPKTPDMARWSRDTMPDFPLPNVSDSPAGRMEYTDSNGRRMSLALSHLNGRQNRIGSPDLSDSYSEGSFGSLPLPSLRAAAKLGMLPHQRDASGSVRNAGPKPLLLRQSARPPREGSSHGLYSSGDEPSRKVSSGPLAHAHGTGSRSTSHTGRDSSMAGSISGRSSLTSDAGSALSTGDSPTTSMTSNYVETLSDPPSLEQKSAAAGGVSPAIPPELTSIGPLSTMSGPIGLMGNSDGTVAAGAFAKVRAAAAGTRKSGPQDFGPAASDDVPHQPRFGEVSSSSDVPLVLAAAAAVAGGGATISRPRANTSRKARSSSTIGAASNSATPTAVSAGRDSSSDGLKTHDSWTTGEALELIDTPTPTGAPGHRQRESIFEKPRAAPRPPSIGSAPSPDAQTEEPSNTKMTKDTITRYELFDEPLPSPLEATTSKACSRSGSSGVVRSKRLGRSRPSTSSAATESNSGTITQNSAAKRTFSTRTSSISRPTLVIPASRLTIYDAVKQGGSADLDGMPLPSPGPGVGEEISTAQLLDQLVPSGVNSHRSSLQRPFSFASNGSRTSSSADVPDLLSDDMFAAPTASLSLDAYHRPTGAPYDDEGNEGEREQRPVSVPHSSTGSYFSNLDNGLEAIGSSLAYLDGDADEHHEVEAERTLESMGVQRPPVGVQ